LRDMNVDWFDPGEDVVIRPGVERARFWRRRYGRDEIEVAPQVIYANNGHGRLLDAVCVALDRRAVVQCDYREQGYCQYDTTAGPVTVYRAPEPAPYAAADLEFLISAGARQIVFLNGAGSLCADLPVGSLLLPERLLREEGTSFHYCPANVELGTSEALNRRILATAEELGVELVRGRHWTTDAIYRETWSKVERYRSLGVHSVDMELSALAGVARYRGCGLSALLVVTDVLARAHTWEGTTTAQFREGVRLAAEIAAGLFAPGVEPVLIQRESL
jgi:uridine phosphorylase